MRNMAEILLSAQALNAQWSVANTSEAVRNLHKAGIVEDWDRSSGEMMVTLSCDGQFVGYLCVYLPLAFVKPEWEPILSTALPNIILCVEVGDFEEKEWVLDAAMLRNTDPDLTWIAQAVHNDHDAFSVNDLWFSTI